MPDAPCRILFVDDDPIVCELTVYAMEVKGFQCDSAQSGVHALKMVNRNHHVESYDAVVTDLHMPLINGHALALDLLARRHAPLIFVLTAVTEPKLTADLLKRGVAEVFFKPPDFELIATTLSSLIERRRAQQKLRAAWS